MTSTNTCQAILVETTGVEPVVPFGRRIYSPLGLPIFLHLQKNGVRYGIRTRILRFLAPCHDALTFRPNAHKIGGLTGNLTHRRLGYYYFETSRCRHHQPKNLVECSRVELLSW